MIDEFVKKYCSLGMMNKVVTGMVSQNIHTILMSNGKDSMRKEFVDFSLLDHMYTSFKIL